MCLIEFTKRWPGLERFVCFSGLRIPGILTPHNNVIFFVGLTAYRVRVFLATSFFVSSFLERRGVVIVLLFFKLWFATALRFDKLRLVTYM